MAVGVAALTSLSALSCSSEPSTPTPSKQAAPAIPAHSIFDADEGTIEMWVKFAFDPLEPHEGYRSHGTLLSLSFGDPAFPNDGITIQATTKNQGRRTSSGMSLLMNARFVAEDKEPMHPLNANLSQNIKRNEWHHFAFTWSQRAGHATAYVDGAPPNQREFALAPFRPNLFTQARLTLGASADGQRAESPIAIDELRISSVERRPEELGFAKGRLQPDAATLLLLNFDAPGSAAIVPQFSASPEAASALAVAPPHRLIEGKFGQALAFTPEKFEP